MTRAVLVLAALLAACGPYVQRARTTTTAQAYPRETEARERVLSRRCTPRDARIWLPGWSQYCLRKDGAAATLMAVGVSEIAVGISVAVASDEGIEHPGAFIPIVAGTDAMAYSVSDVLLDLQLSQHKLYVPQDTFGELLLAPFNGRVLARPSVWLGILALTATGVGASLLVDETWSSEHLGDDPNLFGATMDARAGYPLAFGTGALLFEQVAIAEEAMFRGVVQSGLARRWGETGGWIGASALFGLAHAPNAFFLPEEERRPYLLYGLPFITGIGSYLGLVYRWGDYSLTGPVAIHFWYDFLITGIFFLAHPHDSPLAARVTIPF